MALRTLLLFAAAGLASLAVASSVVSAKGGPYVDGATISGSGLAQPNIVSFVLPESYDDMYEAPASPAQASGTLATWYDITLHYDFEETGHGRRAWQGKFDGVDYLYFPEAMVVGPGTWSAGWFRANPLLAAELQRALAPSPPASGSGTSAGSGASNYLVVVGLSLMAAGFAALGLSRPKR